MRLPRKLKKKLQKERWKHFLENHEEIISEMVFKKMMEDIKNIKPDLKEVAKAWPSMDEAQRL